MESTITTCGCNFFISRKITAVSVSVNKKNWSCAISNRSARILICCSLSSPLMYKTRKSFSCRPFWRNKVLLPIPGSPATSTILPGTMPPPNTRFNSVSEVKMRSSCEVITSCSAIDLCILFSPLLSFQFSEFLFPLSNISSVKVFHSEQAGHLPIHFALSYPQLLQKKAVFILLMFQR